MNWNDKELRADQTLLTFGGRAVTYDAGTNHFCYVGGTGSGKTLLTRLQMQSICKIATRHGVPTRMIVYDGKRELIPILHGIFKHLGRTDADEVIKILNPFDRRSVAWDICQDIRRPAHIDELAAMLIPSIGVGSDGSDFWLKSARTVVATVIESFVEFRSQWDLRDLCLALIDEASIRLVTDRREHTKATIDNCLREPKTAAGILLTVTVALRPFRNIAIMWQYAKHKISLRQWLRGGDGILVLGSADTAETAVKALNQLVFKRLSQMILEEQPEVRRDDPRRIWIVLDEFAGAGRLDGMIELATRCRSKGGAIVLTFQDTDHVEQVYGEKLARAIIGQCANLALLKAGSVDTAEWMSLRVGQYRAIDRRMDASNGTNIGRDVSLNSGQSTGEQLMDRRSLLPSHFTNILPIAQGGGINGVFISPSWFEPGREVSVHTVQSSKLFDGGLLWQPSEEVAAYDFIDVDDDGPPERLKPWNAADYTRLNFHKPRPRETERKSETATANQ